MKTLYYILPGLMLAAVIFFIVLGIMSRSGNAAGLIDGKLSACPDKPNCICSEFSGDNSHYLSPLALNKTIAETAMSNLHAVVSELGGEIQTADQYYLAARFKSALFGFVDDLEIRIDVEGQKIHLRSASRVGHGDLGANKKRIDQLKKMYQSRVGS
ncbi:MAG: hypothetical protein ACI9LO_002998 [Planctomycetota bacterium]|jgi:uncharacterized protein (DUF1499 family)